VFFRGKKNKYNGTSYLIPDTKVKQLFYFFLIGICYLVFGIYNNSLMLIKKYVLFFLLLILSTCATAQIDSSFIAVDTIVSVDSTVQIVGEKPFGKSNNIKKKRNRVPLLKRIIKPEKHSPLSAAAYSLALPGAGQIYNKKYWKLPIVYGGLGWMGYRIYRSTKIHKIYRDAYLTRIDDNFTNDTTLVFYSDSNLDNLRLASKKQQELAIIGFGVVYILVAVDAFVDAHLWSFNVNDDLSMSVGPTLLPPTAQQSVSVGLSIQLRGKAPPETTPSFSVLAR